MAIKDFAPQSWIKSRSGETIIKSTLRWILVLLFVLILSIESINF